MTYPMVVLFMAIAILMFLMTYIVPKFSDIVGDLMGGKGMPVITQFVMNASAMMMPINSSPVLTRAAKCSRVSMTRWGAKPNCGKAR